MSVVPGEASESDEELETVGSSLPDLHVDQEKLGDGDTLLTDSQVYQDHFSSEDKTQSPKYDSILHKKLRDKNAAFYKNLTDSVGQVYLSSAKDMASNTQLLIKSKTLVEEVRDNMQQITEELDKIQYRVEMINSCKIIPKFKQFQDDKGAVGGKT